MNILIPHKWLLEHLETDATPEEIQRQLSLSGPSVERIYSANDDVIYDIEVTTNRVDCMSVRGIAREAGVIVPKSQLKSFELPSANNLASETEPLPLPKIFNDPQLSRRIIFVVLSDIQRNPTPQWMADRLQQVEQNVHDAAIDITNYVTHELGHPCHAFDYDKLMSAGGEIHIVEAKEGEKFTTLDQVTYTTLGGEVVFKNGTGEIIDLPSIKGTFNTSIDESTTNILLLIESIIPEKVRFASMTHAIRTVAAQLMEKGVDPHLAEPVLVKSIELYQQLCDAKIASPIYDEYPGRTDPQPIKLPLQTIDQYLGIELDQKKITNILKELECQVKFDGPERTSILTVNPPSFRSDLVIPADIVEEVARIYGYHNLPSTLMTGALPTKQQETTNVTVENHIKHFLAHTGWQEVYTYSLISQELAAQTKIAPDQHLKLINPLTEDRVYLRQTLLPSLQEVVDQNPQRSPVRVFELADTYLPQKNKLPQEELYLGMVSTDTYRVVRGYVETLLESFYVDEYQFTPIDSTTTKDVDRLVSQAAYQQTATITALGKAEEDTHILGTIGTLLDPTRNTLLTGVEIRIPALLQVIKTHPQYHPLAKTMPIVEDITLTLPRSAAVGEVMTTIQQSDPLISSVTLKDVYQQNFTFTIQYHDENANLAVTDIEKIRRQLVDQIEKQYQAQLVGEL